MQRIVVHCSWVRAAVVVAMTVLLSAPSVRAQCGLNITRHVGGETWAVGRVSSDRIAVGHGNVLELYQTANPLSPLPMSPPRRIELDAPATKIDMSFQGPRMAVLRADGRITIATVSYSPSTSIGFPVIIGTGYYVDVVAQGHIIYAAKIYTPTGLPNYIDSQVDIYDDTSGTPTFVTSLSPLIATYGYDKIVKIGNILWCGMHEHRSSLLGIEGWDVSNPAAPVRVVSSLNSSTLGTFTRISAMANVNGRLLLSYRRDSGGVGGQEEDWLRAVDISTPTNPVWHPPVDLNGFAQSMAADGTKLRIAIQNQGVGTWETSNPASLTWLGAYFDTATEVGQMVSLGGTDYWAAGYSGLLTMNEANPAAPSIISRQPVAPLGPSKVRQWSNVTAVLDYSLNTLRLFDFSLAETSQHRGSLFLPLGSYWMEQAELSGGTIGLMCVGTSSLSAQIDIIDITNPTAPVTRSTITGFTASNQINMMAASGSRLYVHTTNNDLRIYELAVPTAPQLRSTTHFGGNFYDFTCMTAWTNAVALGNASLGLWIIDTTSAIAPLVSSVYNPGPGYEVHSIAKSPNWLFVSAKIGQINTPSYTTLLETLNVTNLGNVTRRFAHTLTNGAGFQPLFDELSVVSGSAGKFLVGTNGRYLEYINEWDGIDNSMRLYSLPAGFLTGEAVPFPIARLDVPCATGKVATNGSSMFLAGGPTGLYQFAMPTQWAAGFGLYTHDTHACYNGSLTLFVFPSAIPDATFEWHFLPVSGPDITLVNGPTGWGSNIIISTDNAGITIDTIHPRDAKGVYYVKATNSCGTSVQQFVIDVCTADFNCSGTATVQDVFDFITAWFNNSPAANYNGVGGITVQDIFDFLADWFVGCF